jgi:hypothetical protein
VQHLLVVLAFTGIALQILLVVIALFEPSLPYRIAQPPGPDLNTQEFARILGTLADSQPHRDTRWT